MAYEMCFRFGLLTPQWSSLNLLCTPMSYEDKVNDEREVNDIGLVAKCENGQPMSDETQIDDCEKMVQTQTKTRRRIMVNPNEVDMNSFTDLNTAASREIE